MSARLTGELTRWDDDRGFGFIEPGPVFVHISAFRGVRPVVGDRVTYSRGVGPDGRPRAVAARTGRAAAPRGVFDYLVLAAFVAVLALTLVRLGSPVTIAAWVAGLSVITFLVYWSDKAAARAGRRRVPESTLLALGLLGGWPGGLIAQRVLRHKTSKPSFRAGFWVTVLISVAGVALVVWATRTVPVDL